MKLEDVLAIQTVTHDQRNMVAFILKFCKLHNFNYSIKDGSIYITKGILNKDEYYPCIVAHMDTVHNIESNLTVIKVRDKLIAVNQDSMKQIGIGGDDKVGVYIALELLLTHEKLKVAFFRDEESGCEGSYEADISFFDNCGYVLQCDRRGKSDFITDASFVELSSKEFLKDIDKTLGKYKYKKASGMMTDVMALKELGIAISMANISCGYYNPHTNYEYVSIPDVSNTLSFVRSLLTVLSYKQYPHEYEDNSLYRRWAHSYKYDNFYSERKARREILNLFKITSNQDSYIKTLLADAKSASCEEFLMDYYPDIYYSSYDNYDREFHYDL